SSKGLQALPIRYLALDEISEFPLDTDGRGSPITQAEARQKSWGDLAKTYRSSTPGLAGECRITSMSEAGHRRRADLPCRHCGSYHTIEYDRMQPPSAATNNRVTFSCGECGALIDEVHRADMLAKGVWVPTRVEEGAEPVPEVIGADDLLRW